MGRRRKDGDPLGLAGTRLAFNHGRFFYIHRHGNRWEDVGTDVVEAKRVAALYNDPSATFGTLAYWLREFLADCKLRVKAKALSQRTLDDYADYCDDKGPLMGTFGRMLPERVLPAHIQAYLDENAKLDLPRLTQSNRERACLSSCFSWLIRTGKIHELKVNPCMRASGIKRNAEKPRERYVEDAEYSAVYTAAGLKVRLMMELVYRTLQRPEVDVLAWTPANVVNKDGGKVLRFKQSKTGRALDIALEGRLLALVAEAIGQVPVLRQPLVHRLDGGGYTYDGISAMLKKAQDKVRAEHKKTGGPLAEMPSFGFRDLKGKGATDMWLSGEPIERIQLLCGHADKKTTETYIKARWRETARPNDRQISSG